MNKVHYFPYIFFVLFYFFFDVYPISLSRNFRTSPGGGSLQALDPQGFCLVANASAKLQIFGFCTIFLGGKNDGEFQKP